MVTVLSSDAERADDWADAVHRSIIMARHYGTPCAVLSVGSSFFVRPLSAFRSDRLTDLIAHVSNP